MYCKGNQSKHLKLNLVEDIEDLGGLWQVAGLEGHHALLLIIMMMVTFMIMIILTVSQKKNSFRHIETCTRSLASLQSAGGGHWKH